MKNKDIVINEDELRAKIESLSLEEVKELAYGMLVTRERIRQRTIIYRKNKKQREMNKNEESK